MNRPLEKPLPTSRALRIALVGNPNCGKTTLFNHLTGLRHHVANYPGVTVECREGQLDPSVVLMDLPGCYSLTPRSPDERIVRDVLLGWSRDIPRPDGVVVVVDGANLERNLFLATQIIELGIATIIVCNMMDVVASKGRRIDVGALGRRLGVPVIGTVARDGVGIGAVRAAVRALGGDGPRQAPPALDGGSAVPEAFLEFTRRHRLADERRERLLSELLLNPAVLNPEDAARIELPRGAREELRRIQSTVSNGTLAESLARIQSRYARLSALLCDVVTEPDRSRESGPSDAGSLTDRIDALVTHRVMGLAVFSLIMGLMFLAIFSWAEPLMDAIETGVSLAGAAVGSALGEGMLRDLMVDGVVAGVGNVVVFFPQICILFFFIAILEDTGYMARVAFVMDRVMRGVGLHGKSFIPLLSSFACAVPAIMATRTIEDRRDRLVTILVAPLMSCSARLPIYVLMISLLFAGSAWVQAGVLFGLYALGLGTGLAAATLFKKTILKGPTPAFMMELPPYRRPRAMILIQQTWNRAKHFLIDAGSIILACSVVLWALAYFPRPPAGAQWASDQQLRQSYMGKIGRWIEPAIEPLGFDWQIGVGLTASFAAREVFVATMGVVYGVGEGADERSAPLRDRMAKATHADGRPVYTKLVGLSVMVFYVLACQCMSTLAVVRRETGSWRWPAFIFCYMTALAYGGSLLVYQVGRALGYA